MKFLLKTLLLAGFTALFSLAAKAQLKITDETNAQALVQKLLGEGVIVSNITFTGNPLMAGHFNNISGTKIGIDSGIVLTSGKAKTIKPPSTPPRTGLDEDGSTPAKNKNASTGWGLAGDADLATAIGVPTSDLEDACILEFDFIPLGDTIRFNYVFSSEEYTPAYVCQFNDAFAFFISGPGFPSLTNIALVPGTSTPVSIFNVNDVQFPDPTDACPNNPSYYWDNETNTYFTHDGHTKVFMAWAKVQPCETYHLKLVISDVGDDQFDSGVFLEAKSLSSNAIKIQNLTQVDPSGNSYLVEGCVTGSIKIKRPKVEPTPLNITLSYGGTVTNGVDIQPLPTFVTIPANQTEVTINLLPNIDFIPEGIETLKIYALAGCASGLPTDSAVIQLRDYDILGIVPDTVSICKKGSIQLEATLGYATYQWDANPTLSSTIISNPVATPVSSETTYYCTASIGTCNARDSAFVKWQEIELVSKKNINCKGGSTGEIVVSGLGWVNPVQFSINNGTPQSSSTFSNLPVGHYVVKIHDPISGCIDSVEVDLLQAFPDLSISNAMSQSTCSGNPDGTISATAGGGNSVYLFSIDGINFQTSNIFNVLAGTYTITVKDGNGCTNTAPATVTLNNSVTLDAGLDPTICEGKSTILQAISNSSNFVWTPATGLDNTGISNPTASPVTTTKYYVTATTGICNRVDSVTVLVNPAPVADAGPNKEVCFGGEVRLNGSGGVSFFWTPGSYLSNTSAPDPLVRKLPSTSTYYLSVIDANGCASLKSDPVTVMVTRPTEVRIGNDTSVAINQPLQLYAIDVNHAGFTDYTWDPAHVFNNPTSPNPVAMLTRDTRLIVIAKTPLGCEDSDTMFVKAFKGPDLYVPNAFTPNGDGLNDLLHVIPIGTKEFHYFRLYNRYGQLVFSTTDPRRGWDGKLNGIPQDGPTTFVWIAEAVDFRGALMLKKGTVTVVR